MQGQYFFPAVHVRRGNWGRGQEYQALMALRLVSIQSVRLRRVDDHLAGPGEVQRGGGDAYQLHLPLLEALAAWPDTLGLTLNLLTRPDGARPLNGAIEVALLLSHQAPDKSAAQAGLLGRGANLVALLNSYLNEMEFEAIPHGEETTLQRWLCPLHVESAWAMDRVRETLRLTTDGEGRKKPRAPGFLVPASPQESEEKSGAFLDYLYPWRQRSRTDIARIVEAMLLHPSALWLRVHLRPARPDTMELDRLRASLAACERLLQERPETTLLQLQAHHLRSAVYERLLSLSRPVFRGSCVLYAETELDEAMVAAVAGAMASPPESTVHVPVSLYGGCALRRLTQEELRAAEPPDSSESFTPEEAACAFRIPMPLDFDPAGLPIKSFRTSLIPSQFMQQEQGLSVVLGTNWHRGHSNTVRLADEDRMRHMCIMGQTGVGKSVFLESMVIQDIEQGKGLCFIDPHGDSISKILEYYPIERKDDLVLVDFLDRGHVIPFNLLSFSDDEERDLIIDELYGWIDMRYDLRTTGGPIFEQYFRGFLRMLLTQPPGQEWHPTIGEFVRLFADKKLRDYCRSNTQDPQVRHMVDLALDASGETTLANMAPYVTSKLNLFDLDQGLRIMTAQEEMGLDFDQIMNNGKVVLINLGRGRFGEVVASLLASQIVCRVKTAALRRLMLPPGQRRDFFLYVDEFQNVASQQFSSMLSEARKFRLGLVLANQYAEQLQQRSTLGGSSVLDAVLGNVGSLVCFRLGINDAKTMAGQFYPEFSYHDLMNLPLGVCYMNLKTSRHKPASFSLTSRYLARDPGREEHALRLRAISQARYAIPAEQARENVTRHVNLIDASISSPERRFRS